VVGNFEHSRELWRFVKDVKYLDQVTDYQLLKKEGVVV
jgi:hypothetical protein